MTEFGFDEVYDIIRQKVPRGETRCVEENTAIWFSVTDEWLDSVMSNDENGFKYVEEETCDSDIGPFKVHHIEITKEAAR